MPPTPSTRRFHIGLSFSGDDREYVSEVAAHLAEHFGRERVFYYINFRAELARLNMDTHLQDIYQDECDLVVMFFSESYETKSWCGLEWRAIRSIISARSSHVIFVKFATQSLPDGLFPIDGYLPADQMTSAEISEAIIERYRLEFETDPSTPSPIIMPETRPGKLQVLWTRLKKKPYLISSIIAALLAALALYLFIPRDPLENWIKVATEKKESGVITKDSPIPGDIVKSRAAFEEWWKETPLSEKRKRPNKDIYAALSMSCGIYRIQEAEDSRKPASLSWIDEAIAYFEEAGDTRFLVESLLDKGAVYLDLADIEHTDPADFQKVSEDGDNVLRRATDLAEGPLKAQALRIWSRFLYNLARPKSGALDEDWDNNYLLTAHQRITSALALDPEDGKNLVAYTRTTQRTAANPSQATNPVWTEKLREAQVQLLDYWEKKKDETPLWRDRISPLNVLGVATLEISLREWLALSPAASMENAARHLKEIEEIALSAEREAYTLIRGTQLEEDYDYDFLYDIARMHAARLAIYDHIGAPEAEVELELVIKNLAEAKEKGTAKQWQSALHSLTTTPAFTALKPPRIQTIREETDS